MHIILFFPFSLSRNAMRQNHLLSLSRSSSCPTETVDKLTVSQFRNQPLLAFLSVNGGVEMIKYQKQHLHSFQISPASSSHGQRQEPSMDFPGMMSLQKFVQPLLDLTDISGTLSIPKNRSAKYSFPFTCHHPWHRQPYHVGVLQSDPTHFLQDSQVNQV